MLEAGEWPISAVSCQQRIAFVEALWPILPRMQRPMLLAQAVQAADALAPSLLGLLRLLRDTRKQGHRVFDGAEAVALYESLDSRVEVFRGTVEAEYNDWIFGMAWTLSREQAIQFALDHARRRLQNSAPVVLAMSVAKEDIDGVLFHHASFSLLIDSSATWRLQQAGEINVVSID